jgi:hypothetical protein
VAALCASDIAALLFVIWVWGHIAGADPRATARIARAEDASRPAAEAVLIGAGAASLLAVAFTLAQAGHAHAPARGLLTALSLGSVAVAWISVHTVYILRYARLYHSPPEGGIDFHDDTPPGYLDFAYLALTIGSDLPGVGYHSHRQAPASRSPAPRAAVLPLRSSGRRDHGQFRRRAARPIAARAPLERQPEFSLGRV